MDVAERLAIERVLQLFGADHANVQPHSGASANLAAYLAISKPGDTLLGKNIMAINILKFFLVILEECWLSVFIVYFDLFWLTMQTYISMKGIKIHLY